MNTTTLAANLKTIRKNLNCTQMAMAEVLDIGFRTYVRYEAGERDAPVAVLVKLAKLGNISLDRLLTTRITQEDLKTPDQVKTPTTPKKLEVVSGSLNEGRLMFKGVKDDFLVSTNKEERKLLNMFRKMGKANRDRCLGDVEGVLKNSKKRNGTGKKVAKKVLKTRNASKLKKLARNIKKTTLKG